MGYFFFELSRLMATAIIIAVALFAAIFISPWSLLLGLPLIILSLIVVIDPLRKF
jgi:acyl-CoA dehydrogenase